MHYIHPFDEEMLALSNAPHNGGLFKAKGFFFMHVHKNYDGDYKKDCLEFERKNGLNNFVGFMTAAEIPKVLSAAKIGSVEAYLLKASGQGCGKSSNEQSNRKAKLF